MNTDSIMRETQRKITEATIDMETETYCWFMRELAGWCENQADCQEYGNEIMEAYYEDE